MMINGKLTSSRALASRYTTRPCLLRSSLNCQATSRPKPPLLNREKEATALKSILVASPRAVHVLVGPRSCKVVTWFAHAYPDTYVHTNYTTHARIRTQHTLAPKQHLHGLLSGNGLYSFAVTRHTRHNIPISPLLCRLLQHVIDELKEEGRSCVSLNGRLGSLRTPEDLTRALALGAANAFPSGAQCILQALALFLTHTHAHTYTHTYTYACTRTRTRTHIYTHTHRRTHPHIHTRTHTHTTHTRTHTHTHTHTQHTHARTHARTHLHIGRGHARMHAHLFVHAWRACTCMT